MQLSHPVPDPLVDRFALHELPRYAPWVAEQIDLVGPAKVAGELRSAGCDPDEPQRMHDWVAALSRCNTPFWGVA